MLAIFGFLKTFKISWKALLFAILVLAVICTIKWGYDYVEGLQNKVTAQAAELSVVKLERSIAEARATELSVAQAVMADRLNNFNQSRLNAETENQRLRDRLAELNLEQELAHDAEAARDRLNARTRELNRLLEQATRF